jgi:hypothetical protein
MTMNNPTPPAAKTDYQILGLKPGCSAQELRTAYMLLVKKWHPDRILNEPAAKFAAEEKLKAINAAYSRLRKNASGQPVQGDPEPAQPRRQPSQAAPPRQRHRKPSKDMSWSSHLQVNLAAAFHRFLSDRLTLRPFRHSWVRTAAVLCALTPLLLLWVDARHLSLLEDWSLFVSTDHKKAPPPMITVETKAKRPAQELSSEVIHPAASPLTERPPIQPPRQGPRRPPGGLAEAKPHFTLGSPRHEVLKIQGQPHRVNGQTWVYGLSDVAFREGRVSGYNNFDGSLNVRLLPLMPMPAGQRPTAFTIGAHKDEVLYAQGTPTRVEGNKWYYGLSEITFKDGKVFAFNNFFNSLKVNMQPAEASRPKTSSHGFSIGSTQDEVLASQGTPTGVQANLWSYELSDVWFHDGRVRAVNDFSHVLKFQAPDSPP